MKKNANRYSVEMMSKALGVSRSGYYKWLKTSDMEPIHAELDRKIKVAFDKSRGRYGSPRVHLSLSTGGDNDPVSAVSRATIGRRMKALELVARPKGRFVVTTDSEHDLKISDNLLNRNFEAGQINKKWVGDLTYIPTDKGWRYLTTVIDLGDRSVVGWTLSKTMHAGCTTVKALKKALEKRGINGKTPLEAFIEKRHKQAA